MAKHKRKRFLSILITAVLVFTLALSSVMAQDDEHVRTDKLSVGGEDVEEDLKKATITDAEIMNLSAGDIEDEDDYGIRTLADEITVYVGDGETYSKIEDAISATTGSYDEIKIMLSSDVEEATSSGGSYMPFQTATTFTLDLNGHTVKMNDNAHMEVFTTLILTDSVGGGSIDHAQDQGHSGGAIIVNGGTLIMDSGAITNGSTAQSGGAVSVENSGTFEMSGGTISGNTASSYGGGVYVDSNGTFTMSGDAVISGNTASNGGGVYVNSNGTFTMSGDAVISGNTATSNGGGVYVSANGTFTMNNGTMDANEATGSSSKGGGVYVSSGASFIMNGGTISNSVAKSNGGGVYTEGAFTLAGGTITGNTGAHGGGVDVNGGSCTVLGGSVTGNTAVGDSEEDRGGGVSNIYLAGSGANRRYITLGASLSGSSQIGVKVELGVNPPTESVPVQFTTSESGTGTEYYATSASYFFSDEGYGVRSSSDGAYLELYLQSFEEKYLTGDDGELYTSATADNYLQILSGKDAWDALTDEEKELVNADLTAANGGETLTYQMLLDQAQAIADEVNAFENSYLGGADSLYTEATADNYKDILAGASDWDAMSDEAKAAVNADLTAANGGVELTYEDLLAQAFCLKYLTDEEGDGPYTEATLDNYEQILSGADDWALMSDEAKDAVNKALQEASGDSSLTYDDLLAQAQAFSAASDFIYSYVSDSDADNPYLEATAGNYAQILSGEDAWDAMSEAEQAAVNAILTEANGGEELTYPMLLAQAKAMGFEDSYLTGSDGELYTEATTDNYEQILAGESDWDALSDEAKAQINADLTAANGGVELTYPMLLAQAKAFDFEEKYLTDENGNGPYTETTLSNMDQILAGADDWNAMSDEEKAAVNAALTEANSGVPLTYDELLAQAFMLKYLTDEDGNLYTGVNADNYLKILSGADDWNRLSPEAQALVNMYLTAAWQDEGNEGELTYPMLLEEAEAFAASLGNVKTGDSTHLYLYVILAAAAAAAATGAAVSRRRRA